MNRERERRLYELLKDVLLQPPESRRAFVAGIADLEPADCERLLAMARRGEESARDSMPDELQAAQAAEGSGSHIGPYRLLEEIGEGGFGVVFLAEQESPVRRRVALKVIKPGMDTRQVTARFEQERQALALMDHPNIARVFDAGATASGRPYFVMELVRGDPITTYCDRERLTMPERLRLFTDVCRAVQHAHHKGVIHRDLKPSNVLVTLIDGKPVPKVIDFGVSKAMQGRLTDLTLFTGHRQMVGTPTYMSPEQAQFSGVDVDTRSDVYSLGVLLYELLVGVPPFSREQLMEAGLEEMFRIIREREPQRPSTRVATLGSTTTTVAAQRRIEPRKLGVLLRGDLDWIVLKCLEKERARRYDSASDLAQDLERHLTGEPVEAAPPSTMYRVRKLVRRRRAAFVVGTGVALVALTSGALTLSAEARRAEAEEARANEALRRERDAVAATVLQKELAESATRARDEALENERQARQQGYVANIMAADASRRNAEVAEAMRRLEACEPSLRNWEWAYQSSMLNGYLYGLDADVPTGQVDDDHGQFALSPDGRWIATVAKSGAIDTWDARTGQHVRQLVREPDGSSVIAVHPNGSVAFSANSQRVLTVSCATGAAIWSLDGQLEAQLDLEPPIESCNNGAFSSDGTLVMVQADRSLHVFDTTTGSPVSSMTSNEGAMCHVEFSHDGTRIVMGTGGKVVHVWDARTGSLLFDLPGSEATPFGTFSPDDSLIVTCSWYRSLLWDGRTGQFIAKLDDSGVDCARFNPDGSLLATGSGKLRVWNTATRELVAEVPTASSVTWVEWSEDGRFIVSALGNGTTRIWDASLKPRGSPLMGGPGSFAYATFMSGCNRILTAGGDGRLLIWSLEELRPRALESVQTIVDQPVPSAFSPDDTRIAVASGKEVAVYDERSDEVLLHLVGHTEAVQSISYSPNGELIVTAAADGSVRIWDAISGQELRRLALIRPWGATARFSPDGASVVTVVQGPDTGTLQVWEASTGRCTRTLDCEESWDLQYSPGGEYLAVVGWETIRLIRVDSDAEPILFSPGGRRAHFSPDGSRLVVASEDGVARVVRIADRSEEVVLRGHEEPVRDACFSPDGSRLVTASIDGTARVWTREGTTVAVLEGGGGWLSSVSVSHDGTRILTTSHSGSVRLFDATPASTRDVEREGLRSVESAARQLVDAVAMESRGIGEALSEVRHRTDSGAPLRRAALNALSRRAEAARTRASELNALRSEHSWLMRLLGREAWPDEESEWEGLERELEYRGYDSKRDSFAMDVMAWEYVDPENPRYGHEVRALLLSRAAMKIGLEFWQEPRDTLARALYMMGRFDEALEAERGALSVTPPAQRAAAEERLRRMESDIGTLRDEAGRLRTESIESRARALAEEIARFEMDPDVALWTGSGSGTSSR